MVALLCGRAASFRSLAFVTAPRKLATSSRQQKLARRLLSTQQQDYDVLNRERGLDRYEPAAFESDIYQWWERSGCFLPDSNGNSKEKKPYVLPMPPPNVTGRLHMGHAMFVALQDVLARFHRMRGRPVLWLPGTDHAGIATQ